jgi:hypothetical protein
VAPETVSGGGEVGAPAETPAVGAGRHHLAGRFFTGAFFFLERLTGFGFSSGNPGYLRFL